MRSSIHHAALLLAALAVPARAADARLTVDLGAGVTLDLVLVPHGSFREGSPPGEAGRGPDEAPREVAIARDFYMGRLPVTRGQFALFAAETRYRTAAERGESGGVGWDGHALVQRKEFNWRSPGFAQTDEHPVCLVTFEDAQAFCRWLGGKARRAVDLPTEAQWEFACRAGTTTRFYAGDSDDDARAVAWFKGTAGDGTRPCGGKRANALGLADTSGNVYEWCRDFYGASYGAAASDPEETRPDAGAAEADKTRRVLRGGSWLSDARRCRSAARHRSSPGTRSAEIGFRVAAAAAGSESGAATGAAPAAPATPRAPVAPPASTVPRAPVAPPAAATTSDGGMGGLICGLVAVVAVIAILFSYFRASSQRAQMSQQQPPPQWPAQPPPQQPPVMSPYVSPMAPPPQGYYGAPQQQPPQGSYGYGAQPVRPAADGFWLDAAKVAAGAAGATILYRYFFDGRERTGSFTAQPGAGQQFIYTGHLPQDVQITGVRPIDTSGPMGVILPPESPSMGVILPAESPAAAPQQPFSGYPTAY